jgi:acetyltransferase EpsM
MSLDKKRLVLVGMGGHSKVVRDIALRNGYEVLGHLDDRAPATPREDYLGTLADAPNWFAEAEFVIAIGSNASRRAIVARLQVEARLAEAGEVRFATLIDPSAILGSGVEIGEGTVLMPGAIVNSDAQIGRHAILNTGATVDHDCIIGDYAHVSPGVNLAGGVHVGEAAHVGIGASAIPQVRIGEGAVIGAGAAVIRDIPAHVVAIGVPAKVMKPAVTA